MIEVFEKVYEKLKEVDLGEGAVLWIDVWNEQTERQDQNYPLFLPAVFVEFNQIDYQQFKKYTQKGTATITLHICQNHIGVNTHDGAFNKSMAYLELLEKVYLACQGLSGNTFTPFDRKQVRQKPRIDTKIVYEMAFSTTIQDDSKLDEYNSQLISANPDIQPERII